MFLLRWIKNLIVLLLVIAGILYVANYKYHGRSIKEHIFDAKESGLIGEAVKDLKTWISELFRTGKKVADDGITKKDREELEKVIGSELKEGVEKLKEEAAKKAKEAREAAEAADKAAKAEDKKN